MSTETRSAEFEALARAYARLGLALAWTDPRDPEDPDASKRCGSGWKRARPEAPDFAAGLFVQRVETRNPAVVLRASGLVGIDVDGAEGARALAKLIPEGLPQTATILSGRPGGRHHWYRAPEGWTGPVKVEFSKKVTASADGYFVCPPAVHANGREYRFHDDRIPREQDIAEIPVGILTRIAAAAGERPKGWGAAPGERIAEGGRNDALFRMGAAMRRRGMGEEAILAALMVENAARCTPPLKSAEVEAVAESAAGYAPTPDDAPPGEPVCDGPPPDGADVLERVMEFVRRFVVMSDSERVTLALWVAHAHAIDAAEATPYLALTSAEKRSGKSRALEVLALLVPRPLPTANVSPAAVYRVIADEAPTLLIDETDAIFGGNKERGEELRGLLNAGHRRGAEAIRMVGMGNAMKAERFPVYCAKALAGIGDLPDTIADRSIAIRLKRRRAGEQVERFRHRTVAPQGAELRALMSAWVVDYLDALADAKPNLPDQLDDRAADGWEPLLAIADLAGGTWPTRAREAALALSVVRGKTGTDSHGVRLLADVRRAFDEAGVDRVSSADLCAALNTLEESPWGAWRDGKGIDPRTLARRLREYDIVPGTVRLADGTQAKGYQREKLTDAWDRYCPAEASPENALGLPSAPPAPFAPLSSRPNVTTSMDSGISVESDPSQTGSWDGPKSGENPYGDRDVTAGRTVGPHTEGEEVGDGSPRLLDEHHAAMSRLMNRASRDPAADEYAERFRRQHEPRWAPSPLPASDDTDGEDS